MPVTDKNGYEWTIAEMKRLLGAKTSEESVAIAKEIIEEREAHTNGTES